MGDQGSAHSPGVGVSMNDTGDDQVYGLDPEDDLIAMEQSTFQTFVDPAQADILLRMWRRSSTQPLPKKAKESTLPEGK